MGNPQMSAEAVTQSEHIDPSITGDNIPAKRVANYKWDGQAWNRSIGGLFTLPYDQLAWSNPDAGGNYQTIISKLNGTTQQTLTLSYDGANNVTNITRS